MIGYWEFMRGMVAVIGGAVAIFFAIWASVKIVELIDRKLASRKLSNKEFGDFVLLAIIIGFVFYFWSVGWFLLWILCKFVFLKG